MKLNMKSLRRWILILPNMLQQVQGGRAEWGIISAATAGQGRAAFLSRVHDAVRRHLQVVAEYQVRVRVVRACVCACVCVCVCVCVCMSVCVSKSIIGEACRVAVSRT